MSSAEGCLIGFTTWKQSQFLSCWFGGVKNFLTEHPASVKAVLRASLAAVFLCSAPIFGLKTIGLDIASRPGNNRPRNGSCKILETQGGQTTHCKADRRTGSCESARDDRAR